MEHRARVIVEEYEKKLNFDKIKYNNDLLFLDQNFYYNEAPLGCCFSEEGTTFRIWSPFAISVHLNIYREGNGNNLLKQLIMDKEDNGTFFLNVSGNLKGLYYTYFMTYKRQIFEIVDPYAKAVGVNGKRGMILDLKDTDPPGWNKDIKPVFKSFTDAIIYELHIRDFTMDKSSHIKRCGKYLGLVEPETKNKAGLATGLDHLKELGISHVHLLPCFDFISIDETQEKQAQYNWGYDPQNYNVPEGSYCADPYHGEFRIRQFKKMVQAFHNNGIRVIMDVVYNHTCDPSKTCFEGAVPEYYYRMDNGHFSNGSACGNEFASEHKMVRKYIVDSVCFWAREYHIDGFRFDLMGLHDINTMKEIRRKLNEIDSSILIYGEGWLAGDSTLPPEKRAVKNNMTKLPGIAAFNDTLRDGIKGSVFDFEAPGFISGEEKKEEAVKFGLAGACGHPELHTYVPWALSPAQSVNYVSSHDDLSLWDKIAVSAPNYAEKERIKMNMLAAAIVLTSQGIPFFQAGEELLKTKPKKDTKFPYESNSYCSPDDVNTIKWDRKTKYYEVFKYYQGLIELRKAHKLFRLETREEAAGYLTFIEQAEKNIIVTNLKGYGEDIIAIYNANKNPVPVKLCNGIWDIYVEGEKAGNQKIRQISGENVMASPIACMVLIRKNR